MPGRQPNFLRSTRVNLPERPSAGVASTLEGSWLRQPVDVEEYGAVAFVINVDEFRKL